MSGNERNRRPAVSVAHSDSPALDHLTRKHTGDDPWNTC